MSKGLFIHSNGMFHEWVKIECCPKQNLSSEVFTKYSCCLNFNRNRMLFCCFSFTIRPSAVPSSCATINWQTARCFIHLYLHHTIFGRVVGHNSGTYHLNEKRQGKHYIWLYPRVQKGEKAGERETRSLAPLTESIWLAARQYSTDCLRSKDFKAYTDLRQRFSSPWLKGLRCAQPKPKRFDQFTTILSRRRSVLSGMVTHTRFILISLLRVATRSWNQFFCILALVSIQPLKSLASPSDLLEEFFSQKWSFARNRG